MTARAVCDCGWTDTGAPADVEASPAREHVANLLAAGSGSGYSTRSDNGRRERIWFSPACLADYYQPDLFAEVTHAD